MCVNDVVRLWVEPWRECKFSVQPKYCPEQAPMGACSSSCQKLRVGGYTEKVLEWFNYPRARAHPGWEVNFQGVPNRRFMLCRGQPDSGESCIVLQTESWPTRSLVAKFPQRSVTTCSTQISCHRERTPRTRPWTGVLPDVVASKALSQLYELSGSTFGFNMQEFSMVGGYMENLKNHKNCQNWRVGACLGMGACSGQY